MKEEYSKDMETFKKKSKGNLKIKWPLNKIKNTVTSHSNRLEQVEDGIPGLEDKIDIEGKIEEFLDKRLKSCKRNIQELCDSIKRSYL
jgi:hypothetical protein